MVSQATDTPHSGSFHSIAPFKGFWVPTVGAPQLGAVNPPMPGFAERSSVVQKDNANKQEGDKASLSD